MWFANRELMRSSPGRFYASISMKLIIAHIVKGYDLKLLDQNKERSSTWRSYVFPRQDVFMQLFPRNKEEVGHVFAATPGHLND